jgi:hypothetical protein
MALQRSAAFWRDAAERVRHEAGQAIDAESKMILLQIVDAYERLAKRADANRPNGGGISKRGATR